MDTALIKRSARTLLDASPPGSQVLLFGSRARGDARPDSDVDFVVIQPTVRARLAEAARLARILRPLRIPADILVVDQAEFDHCKDVPTSVIYHAHREGRRIA